MKAVLMLFAFALALVPLCVFAFLAAELAESGHDAWAAVCFATAFIVTPRWK